MVMMAGRLDMSWPLQIPGRSTRRDVLVYGDAARTGANGQKTAVGSLRRVSRCRDRGLATLVLVAMLGSMISGCSDGTPATSTTPISSGLIPSSGLTWVITRQALSDMAKAPPALAVLEAGHIYEIVAEGKFPISGIKATVTADFKSYEGPEGMAQTVADGDLPSGTGALLYDPEKWVFTPTIEQRSLATYVTKAIALAQSKGLELVVTPGVDLTSVLVAGTTSSNTPQHFLESVIDSDVSGADIVDVQAQSLERDAASYAAFVKAAAAQILASNPHATVIAGLSTNPPGSPVTSAMLVAAIDSVRGTVSGFWLNVPEGASSICPNCGPPAPQVGIQALEAAFRDAAG
jgi:hypothetical protein